MPAKRFSHASLLCLALSSPGVAQTTLNFNPGENWGDNISDNLIANVAAGTGSISGTIFSTASVTKNGAGTLVLTGPNSYSGGTTITGGTLSVANASKLGTGDVTATGGGALSATLLEFNGPRTITITGAGSSLTSGYLWFNRDNSADLQTLNIAAGGSVSIADTVSFADLNVGSTGNVNVTGSGSLLSAVNTIYVGYSGNSTATVADGGTITANAILSIATTGGSHGTFNLNDGGTLQVGGAGGIAIGAGSGLFNASGGTIKIIGSDLTSAADMTLGDGTTSTVNTNGFGATLSGVLSGPGALTKSGAGTLTLTEANTYNGATTISAGTLALGDANALQNSTATLSGGSLAFGALTSANLGGLAGSTGLVLENDSEVAVALNVGANNASTAYSGGLSGDGSLTKTGSGTLTLSGTNTFTSGLNVTGGILSAGNAAPLGAGDISVTGGTLAGSMHLSIDQDVTVEGGDAALTTVGYLEIGSIGTGSLTIADGGQVTSGTSTAFGVVKDVNGTAVGTGMVTGTNSRLDTTGMLYVGYQGTGTLDIENGGTVSAGGATLGAEASGIGNINVNAGGTLELAGIGTVIQGDGAGSINLNAGTLKATDTLTTAVPIALGTSTDSTIDTDGHAATLSGTISGAGNLIKSGANTLTLSSANTFSGTVAIWEGALELTHSDALQFATVASTQAIDWGSLSAVSFGALTGSQIGLALENDASQPVALTVGANNASTEFSGTFNGSGSLIKTGTGTLYLSYNSDNFTGSTTIEEGVLQIYQDRSLGIAAGNELIMDGGTLRTTYNFALNSDRAITLNAGGGTFDGNFTYDGVITGTGDLTKAGAGTTLVLGGANTFSGQTDVTAGTLQISHAQALQNSTLVLDGTGQVITNGVTTLYLGGLSGSEDILEDGPEESGIAAEISSHLVVGANGDNTTYSGVIDGLDRTFTKTGTGTLTLSGNNTYGGGTTITDGTLALASDAALGTTAGGTSVESTGTLAFTNGITVGAEAIASEGTVDNLSGTNSYAGALSGLGNLTVTAGQLTLSGNNTYEGSTAINGGTLTLGHDNALGATSAVDVADGATLDLNNHSVTIADLDTTGTGAIALGSATLTTGDSNDHALSGEISGTGGSLTKTGSGTLTLTDYNSYTGATRIDSGTLAVSGENAAIDSTSEISIGRAAEATLTVTDHALVFSNSTLTLGETATGVGTLNITAPGIVAPTGQALTVFAYGDATIGIEGTGNVAISGGGVLAAAGDIRLATGENGNATVSATGTYENSEFRSGLGAGGALVIAQGDNSIATFTVSDGANAGADAGIEIAAGTNSTGTLTVTGSDITAGTHSQLGAANVLGAETAPPLTIALATGSGSTAHLNILNGGEVILTDDTTNEIHALTKGPGTATVTIDDGILSTTTGGTLTSNVDIITAGNNTLNTEDATIALSGVISGSGALNKTGSGTLTLSGDNTFSGDTTISAGTLVLGHEHALQNSTLTTATGLDFGTLTSATLGGLSGPQDLALINTDTVPAVVALTIGQNDADTEYSGVLSGDGSLTKTGSGTLTLLGTNTYSGASTINEGTLSINADSALGTAPSSPTAGHLTLDGGTLATTDTFTLDANRGVALGSTGGTFNTASSTTFTVAGDISGTGALSKTGDGTLALTGANDYSGGTTVSAGTLSGNTASLQGDITNDAAVVFDQASTGTYADVLSGTGTLTKTGNGTLAFTAAQGYTGDTNVAAGSLDLQTSNALAGSAPVSVASGASIDFNSNNQTFGSLAGAGNVDLGSATLTTGDSNDTTVSGIISGEYGALVKNGTGTLTLSGVNTYTGSTTINAGTIAIAADSGLGAAPESANSSQLTLNGGTLLATTTVALDANRGIYLDSSGGTLTSTYPTTLTVNGEITGNGNLGIDGEGNVTLARDNAFSGTTTLLDADGTLTLGDVDALKNSHLTTTGGLRFGSLESANLVAISGSQDLVLQNGSNAAVALKLGENNSATTTHSGVISGSGSIELAGGDLTLSGANTFTGATTFANGNLTLANESGLQNSTVTLSGGNLSYGSGVDAVTFGGLAGSYDLTLPSTSLTVGGNHADTTYSGTVSNSGTFIKAGDGNLTFSGSFNDSAPVRLDRGTFTLANANALERSIVTLNGGALSFGTLTSASLDGLNGSTNLALTNVATTPANVALTVGYNNGDSTYAGVLSGGGSLTKDGSGTFTLSGANTFTGTTSLQGGTLVLGHSQALQSSVLEQNGGTVSFGSLTAATLGGLDSYDSIAISNLALTLDVASGAFDDLDYSGTLSGNGSLTKTGAGTQELSGSNTYSGGTTINAGTLILSGANTSAGDTTVSGGTLQLANEYALQNSTLVTSSAGGSVDFGSLNSANLGGLQGSGILAAGSSSLTLNVGANDASTTFSGILADNGFNQLSLTKSGSGTLTLTGANTFSGDLNVTGGSLDLDHTNAAQNAVINFNDGVHILFESIQTATVGGLSGSGSLDLTNQSYEGVSLTLNVGTGFGEDPELTGNLTGTGSLTKTGAGTQVLSGSNAYSGTTTISAGTLVLEGANTTTGDTTVTGGTLRLTNEDALQNSTLVTSSAGGSVDLDTLSSLNLGGLEGSGNLSSGYSSLALNVGANDQSTTYSGILADGGFSQLSLTKIGNGTLTLSGANTFSGTTTVSGGTLQLDHASALQNSVVTPGNGLTFGTIETATFGGLTGSGSLGLTNTAETPAAVALTLNVAPGSGEDDLNFSGSLTGAGSITKTGTGSQILSGNNSHLGGTTVSAGTLVLAAANTSTGDTTVTGGTLRLTHTNALQNSTLVTTSGGGAVDFDSLSTVNLGGLEGSGNLSANFSELSLNVGANGADTTYSGILADGGPSKLNLTKSGNGTLTLSGANTFSGTATVSAGTLNLRGVNTYTGDTTVADSTTLSLNQGGNVTQSGNVVVNNGALDVTDSGTFTALGSATFNSESTPFATSLTVRNGATFAITGDTTLNQSAAINLTNGGSFDSAGALTVNDDATLSAAAGGSFQVDGQLTLADNAAFTGGSSSTTHVGSFVASGANVLQLTNGANLTSVGDATFGGTSSLSTSASGNLTAQSDLILANGASDNVSLTLTENTSTVTGDVQLGQAGTGSINVTFAALNVGGAMILGNDADSSGSLTVTQGSLGVGGTDGIRQGSGAATVTFDAASLNVIGSNLTTSVDLATANTFTVNTSALDATLSGDIGGTASLSKYGSGTLTLSGSNTYAGATLVNAGTLSIAADSALGTAPGSPTADHLSLNGTLATTDSFTLSAHRGMTLESSGGTLQTAASTTLTYGGIIDGDGALTKTGSGTLSLTGTNTYAGGTAVNAGTLAVTNQDQLGTGEITITNGGTLSASDPTQWTQNLTIDGSGSRFVAPSSSGNLNTFDPADFSGSAATTTTVTNGGSLEAGFLGFSGSTSEASTVEVSAGGSLTAQQSLVVGYGNQHALTFNVTGAGSSVTASDINNYTSNALVIGAGNPNALATMTVSDGGSVSAEATFIGFNVVFAGQGQLDINDGGTVQTQAVVLTSTGSDQATLNLNTGGSLRIVGGHDALQSGFGSYNVNLNGGTFTAATNTFSADVDATLGSGTTTTFHTDGVNAFWIGDLSGSGNLTKTGAETLTLDGANTTTGTFTIAGGTLALGADGTIANSAGLDLGTAGTLDLTAKTSGFTFGADQTLSGTGTVNLASGQAITLEGSLAPGNSPGIMTFNGDLTLASTATTLLEISGAGGMAGTDFDQIIATGSITFGGTLNVALLDNFTPAIGQSFQLFSASSIGGTFANLNLPTLSGAIWNTSALATSGTLSVVNASAVPEPATAAGLAGLVILGLAASRRRRCRPTA